MAAGSAVTGLPEGLTARPATMQDVDEVVAVIHAAERASTGGPLTSRADVDGDWRRPGMDLERETVVVESAGNIVAHAEQYRGRAFTHVHPAWTGRGIGAALAGWVERRARDLGLEQVGQTIPDEDEGARRLLEGRGWQPRWTSWLLERDLQDRRAGAPRLRDGITIRPVDLAVEARELYDVVNRAFDDWPDRDPPMDFDDWRVSLLDRTQADPGLALVAAQDSAILGGAICMAEDGVGWVDALAVSRAHRGQGLGGALLDAAFDAFAERGLRTAALSTDSRTGALTLYLHVGMRVTRSFTRWSHVLV